MMHINQSDYFDKIKKMGVIVLYGAGSKAKQAAKTLERLGINISEVCDNDTTRYGELFLGHTICSFEDVISRHDKDRVCVLLTVSINNALAIAEGISDSFSGIMHQLCIPFKTESRLLWQDEYDNHKDIICSIREFLADELSVDVYDRCIDCKLTGDFIPLCQYLSNTEVQYSFFDREIMGDCQGYGLLDIGAYTGDTAISFAMFTSGNYASIDAFEADDNIYKALERCIKYTRVRSVYAHKQALWSYSEEMEWNTVEGDNEQLYDSPNLFRSIDDTVDRNNIMEKGTKKKIKVCKLDDCQLNGKLEPGKVVLKVNAMASDYEIIEGGANFIRKYSPIIVAEYGTRHDDLYRMIPFIKSLNLDYIFYFRVKKVYGDIKVVMYAKEVKNV